MKKTLIIIASTLLVLVLLVVGIVNFYFTNERLQRMVMPYLEESVGRPVQVESMSVSIFSSFPDAALNVRNFSIPESDGDTLFSVQQVSIRLEILPLWYNEFQVSELTFDRPRFIFTAYKDGRTNLDFLTEDTTRTAPSTPRQQPSTPETSRDTALTIIRIPALTLNNARLGYVDRSADSEFLLEQLNARLSLDYADKIKTRLDLQIGRLITRMGQETYVDGLPLSLQQTSVLDPDKEMLTLQEGALAIRGLSIDLNGQLSDWSADGGPVADLEFTSSSDNFAELLKLAPSSYQKELQKLETRGSLALKGTVSGPLTGESLPSFDIMLDVTEGYLKYPDMADPITDIQVNARFNDSELQLNTLNAKAGPNSIKATGTITSVMEPVKSRINLTSDLSLDLATIKNFYPIDPDTLALQGLLNASARVEGKFDNIQQSVQKANITLKNGRIDYQQMGPPLTDLNLEADIRGNRLELRRFTATSSGNTLNASGTVTNYLADVPQLDLRADGSYDFSQTHHYYTLQPYISELSGIITMDASIRGEGFDPLQWSLNGNMQLSDVNARGDSLPRPLQNLNGKLKVTPNTASLTTLSFQLGESDFDMKGKLSHYMEFLSPGEGGSIPRLTGTYQSKQLNIDEFIDWDAESDPETEYPIDLPRLNSSITTQIDKLVIMGISFQNVQGTAGTSPEQIKLTDASAQLLDGSIDGTMTWTIRNPLDTHLDFDGSINKVQASAFFRDFHMLGGNSEFHKYVEGAFSTDVSYRSDINRHLMPEISTTVSSGSFGMTKARLKGHPLQEKVAGLLKTPELANLAMDEWKATYSIKNSVLTMKNLRLTSGNIGAEMEGTQHLEKGDVDYKLKLYLPDRFKDKIASVITTRATEALTRENGTIQVPLRLTGTLENPKVRPDREVIEPIVKDYLKDKAGDVIKSLFK